MVVKIISGGQTGVDQIALEMAKKHGLERGGWTIRNFVTEKGSEREYLLSHGLKEMKTTSYPVRTEKNITESDATVMFGSLTSPGSKLALKLLEKHDKAYICNPTSDELYVFIVEGDIKVLNVAGNRLSKLMKKKVDEITHTLDNTFKRLGFSSKP